MKSCPRCDRKYTDDSLLFCLEDGAKLVKGYDPEATQISPFPPVAAPPPTVGYVAPQLIQVTPPPPPEPLRQKKRSPLVVVALVVGALAVGLVIGGFVIRRLISPSTDSTLNEPRSVSRTTPDATPTPTPTASPKTSPSTTPTATPTPTPTVTPGAADADEQRCVLYNDKSDKAVVRTRLNCDTRDCDSDASTISTEYPDNTPVNVYKGSSVRGSKFTWVKVKIKGSGPGPGTSVWVASTKIKCS